MAEITGTSGNDTLTGTADSDLMRPLSGKDSVDGLGGNDSLLVDYSSVAVDPYAGATIANVPSEVSSTGGAFNGAIRTVDGGNSVTFSNIEHLVVQLDFFHNTFRLNGSALTQGASITIDGGTGNDTLDLDLTALASVDLEVGPEGINASFGQIYNFEIFELDLTGGADHVTTGSGNDILLGNGGDDVLNGAGGQNSLSGGAGTNRLTAGDGDDRFTSEGIDTVTGGGGYDRWTGNYGSSSEDLIFVHNSETGIGDLNNGTNLSGIEWVESITTGSGNDVFTFTAGVGISVSAGSGEDRLYLTGSGWSGTIEADGSAAFRGTLGYDRFSEIEHLIFTSSDGDDSIAVVAAPLLAGATLSLDAAGGHDTLAMDFTGFGGISFVVSGGTVTTSVDATLSNFEAYHILSGSGADTITTGDGDDIVEGKGGVDFIRTAGGNDQLDGGVGADTMRGGDGNDSYSVDNAGDVVTESALSGTDLVRSTLTYTLGSNVENLTLTGAGAINGTGNGLANILVGNAAANVLDGKAGADTMQGGLGNDTYVVDNVGDTIAEWSGEGTDLVQASVTHALAANVENLTLSGAGAINGTGNFLVNVIAGNAGANTLDGSWGADTMNGGLGDDSYVVDNALDKAVEAAGGGTDRVLSAVTFTLGSEVENLTLTGVDSVNATGNGLANLLTGNGADNILNGMAGADTMQGGAGNDTYVIDDLLDQAIESSATGGFDLVHASVSFTLGARVENLTLTGAAAIDGTGNSAANILTGNGAANLLDGGIGADTMQGGAGNDTYVVDNAGDQTIEISASHGIDLVNASVSFTLAAKLENLTLTGAGAINATGNTAANILIGNGAANVLNGMAGADEMRGGLGNDTYVVDNVADQAIETSVAGGTDLVQSSITFTIGTNVENLTLTGTAAVNGTGNGLANVLTGNTGANILNGGAGADTMQGGLGNDTYVVDNIGDQAIEGSATGGTDQVQSSVSYTLAAKLENLTLTGTSSIDGTGNAAANVLTGNAAKNFLDGGAGSDTLFGGGGADRFVFANSPGATNVDTVLDFAPGVDKLLLDDAVFTTLGAGALPAGALVMGSAATDASDRILYDAATGALFYDRDGTGAAAAFQFAVLDTHPASLAPSDFLVI